MPVEVIQNGDYRGEVVDCDTCGRIKPSRFSALRTAQIHAAKTKHHVRVVRT